ncbi:ATP-binding protein [Trichloromonas sp.]|uniref:ATP-binding protein n=1 Tax=Trichloromonas sp. TaxID=3069249 RepID=UPI003D81A69C
MILRSLELKHFGKFAERTFEFRRGMNLVTGPNEAGKSTLMEAIPAVLFGVRNKERYKPWGRNGSCAAALVLEGRNRTIRIERDILTDQVRLTEHDDLYHELYQFEGKVAPNGRSSERGEYYEQLARLFGIYEEDVFRASLFFGQGHLDVPGQAAMTAKIKGLLSGFVEVDYDKVLESLNADLFAITRVNPWGKDKTKDRELEEVTKRIGALETRWFEAREALRELETLRGEMCELDKSIRLDRDEYVKGERYLAWARKQWQLEEKEVVLRKDFARVNRQSVKVGDLEKQRQELEKELGKTGLPREIPEDLVKLLVDADEERKELVSLQGESAALRRELLDHKTPPWKPSAGLSALLFAVGGAAAWFFPERLVQSLLGAGLVTAVIWIFYLWNAGKERAERGRIQGQAQVLERKREEAQARLASLDERFERLGMSPSAVEIVKMQKNLARHQELLGQLKEVEISLKVLDQSEELKRDQDDLTRELAVLDERMEKEKPLRPEGLLPLEELPGAEDKLQALGENLQAREQRLLELTRREAALHGALGDLQQIEEEGERLKARESVLLRRRDALVAAYELLSGSVEEFRRTYLERFAGEICTYLTSATCGRYARARLGEDFSLSLPGKGEGSWQDVDSFSRGTIDAVYFAVRLALTRHLSHGRRLPLFLDDPLVNFDADRQAETMAALESLSREHQIIFFTHSEGLLKRGGQKRWNLISLDEAKNSRIRANEERNDDVGQLHLL